MRRPAAAVLAGAMLLGLVAEPVHSSFTAALRNDANRFAAAAAFPPRSTALPEVAGEPRVGVALTASDGGWARAPHAFAHVWLRCDAAGEHCAEVAAGRSYAPVAADEGRRLRVRVTATNAAGSTTATSAATAPVARAAPTIAGRLEAYERITAVGAPAGARWERCTTSCVDTGDAAQPLVLTSNDVGASIRVDATVAGPVERQAIERAVLADHPAAYYRMNDALADASGHGRHGSFGGGAAASAAGLRGADRAAAFRCCGMLGALPDNLVRSLASPAIELWFRTRDAGVLLGTQDARPFAEPTQWNPPLYVGHDGTLRGTLWRFDSIVTAPGVNDDAWHHAVLQAASGRQELYLDGKLVATTTGVLDGESRWANQLGTGWTRFWTAASWWYFDYTGLLDEVALYDHPLSAERVRAHHEAGR